MATAYERYFGRGLIGSQRPRFLHKSAHAYSVHITKHYHAVDKRSPDAPGVMSGLLAEVCYIPRPVMSLATDDKACSTASRKLCMPF